MALNILPEAFDCRLPLLHARFYRFYTRLDVASCTKEFDMF